MVRAFLPRSDCVDKPPSPVGGKLRAGRGIAALHIFRCIETVAERSFAAATGPRILRREIMRFKTLLLASAAAGAAIVSQPAFAQAEGEQANDRNADIIVTARKQAESILNVPVVENVITQEAIERFAIDDIQDVVAKIPGLVSGNAVLAIGEQMSLRGVGSNALDQGVDQSVSLNIDGLSMTHGLAYRAATFDVAQVEVFKGPQALYYGKNSTAGVISFRTADPTTATDDQGQAGLRSRSPGKARGAGAFRTARRNARHSPCRPDQRFRGLLPQHRGRAARNRGEDAQVQALRRRRELHGPPDPAVEADRQFHRPAQGEHCPGQVPPGRLQPARQLPGRFCPALPPGRLSQRRQLLRRQRGLQLRPQPQRRRCRPGLVSVGAQRRHAVPQRQSEVRLARAELRYHARYRARIRPPDTTGRMPIPSSTARSPATPARRLPRTTSSSGATFPRSCACRPASPTSRSTSRSACTITTAR